MELEKVIVRRMKSTNRNIIKIISATLILLSTTSLSYAQLDTLKITLLIDKTLIINKGHILNNKVRITTSDDIELNKSVYLIKNTEVDSIPITIKFKNHLAKVIITDIHSLNEIHLFKSKFEINRIWHIFPFIIYYIICPKYGLNFNDSSWVTRFWIIENNKTMCKLCS